MNLQGATIKEQIPILYIVRALAFLGVLFVHVASVPVGEISDKGSMMFALFNFMNIFNRFGTTTFIFLSAFILFYRYYDQPVNRKQMLRFYQRRFLYILIPYFIFSIVYYVIQMYYSYGETWPQFFQNTSLIDFLKKLAQGKAFYHFYFVFINAQFYLLFPLLLLLLQRRPSLTKHLVWIGLILQWGFIFYNRYSLDYPDKAHLAISYVSYYFLGAYFGIYYSTLKDWIVITRKKLRTSKAVSWLILWIVWIAASLADVYLWYLTYRGGKFDVLLYELLWYCQTFTASLVLLQISSIMYRKLHPRIVNIWLHLGVISFGVYIVHAGILFYYYRIPMSQDPISYYISNAGAYVATLGLSWAIVGIMQKYVPFAWIFFGTSPKISPYLEWKSSKPTVQSKIAVPIKIQRNGMTR